MWLLPGPRRVALKRRRGIDQVVQPTVPFRRHLRGLGQGLVDDPAARHTQGTDAPALLVVAVAGGIGAHQLAPEGGVKAVRPGVATPPTEDFPDQTHRTSRRQKTPFPGAYDTAAAALSIDPVSRQICHTRVAQNRPYLCMTWG